MARFYPSGGGGAGSGSDDCTATTGDLLKGTTAILSGSDDEPVQGTLELTGDAQPGDVLKNKGFYNVNAKVKSVGTLELTGNANSNEILENRTCYTTDPKTKVTGNMPNNGTVNYTLPINGSYTIPWGFHSGAGRVTQSIPTQGALTLNPGTTGKTGSVSGKYMTGNIWVPAVSIAANVIKKGTRITFPDGSFVDGTFEGYVATATDLYNNGLNPGGFQNPHSSTYGIVMESNMINTNGGSTNHCTLKTNNMYNFTPYSRINIEFYSTRGTNGFAVGYTTMTANPMNANDVTGNDKSWSLNTRTTVWQDISAYQGNAYVVIGEIYGYIYRVWFS